MVKNNKLLKILAIMLVAICLVSVFGGGVNAADGSTDIIGTFTSVNPSEPSGFSSSTITNATNNVMYIIQAVGIVAGIVVLAYMGIKYITSSTDGKAEIKKQAFIYIGGAALLMLAPFVASTIFNMFKQ